MKKIILLILVLVAVTGLAANEKPKPECFSTNGIAVGIPGIIGNIGQGIVSSGKHVENSIHLRGGIGIIPDIYETYIPGVIGVYGQTACFFNPERTGVFLMAICGVDLMLLEGSPYPLPNLGVEIGHAFKSKSNTQFRLSAGVGIPLIARISMTWVHR